MSSIGLRELPFIIGVIGDFVSDPKESFVLIKNRKFIEIDRDNFDQVIAAYKPRLNFKVENLIDNNQSDINIELNFASLADFSAENVARQVKPLFELIGKREESDDKSDLDIKISAQLSQIIHHSDFKNLEATWRGLHYLVSNTESSHHLKIQMMQITKAEWRKDFEKCMDFSQSSFFQKGLVEKYQYSYWSPLAALIGIYEFGSDPVDLFILKNLAQIAEESQTPFISAVSPKMFGAERHSDLNHISNFSACLDSSWNKFRTLSESQFTSLCLPRFLLRKAYAEKFRQSASFDFTEEIHSSDDYLWGNPAFVFGVKLAELFARYGWVAKLDGEENVLFNRLPAVEKICENPTEKKYRESPLELILNQDQLVELSDNGFNPLVNSDEEGEVYFFLAKSAAKIDEDYSDLPLTFIVSRFIHYIKSACRYGPVGVQDKEILRGDSELNKFVSQWIRDYFIYSKNIKSALLAEAKINVTEDRERGFGHYIFDVFIKPQYHFPNLKNGRRVVFRDYFSWGRLS